MHLSPIPLSDTFLVTLRRVARDVLGPGAPDGSALAAAVRDVSHHYNHARAEVARVGGDTTPLTARLRFFLPRDLFKVWGPLSELWALGRLPRRDPLRVLDVGAGLGTTTLGVASFVAHTGSHGGLEVLALDRDARALSVMQRLVADPAGLPCVPVQLRVDAADVGRLGPSDGPFDLVVAGLSLNELTQAADGETARAELVLAWIDQAFALLAEDGALVIVEPALKQSSRVLQRVRDALQARGRQPFVFAPCLGIAHCPMLARPRDWCHTVLPLAFPPALAALAKAAGLRQSDPSYSYLTLRAQPGNLGVLGDSEREPLRVVGGPVRSKGKVELDLCGQRTAPRLLSLDRHRDKRADVLADVTRGTVLGVNRALTEQPGAERRLRLPAGEAPTPYTAPLPGGKAPAHRRGP